MKVEDNILGFYKKTILLSNKQNYEKGMGVLCIEKNNGGIFGTLKTYDFNAENLVLAIGINKDKILKQNVFLDNGATFTFKLDNNFDIDASLGCVLCNVSSCVYTPLLWGSSSAKAQLVADVILGLENDNVKQKENREIKPNFEDVHSTMQTTQMPAEKQLDNMDKKIDHVENMTSEKDKASLFEIDEDEVEKTIDSELNDPKNFFDLIGGQVDELFEKYPHDENLAKMIPNSKWVRVDFDQSGKEYLFGLLYENGELKYICYGVPGTYSQEPPEELRKFSQWLPLDPADPETGYWVMFQDAETGDSIEIDDLKIS